MGRALATTQTRRKPSGFVALLALAALSSGCASNQYMGISLRPGGADPAVQTLAVKAQSGDKQAQYELGRWFEDSTEPNGLKKAIKLYRIAATPRGGMRLLYVPGPSGVTSSVVSTGPKIEAYEPAIARLRIISTNTNTEDGVFQFSKPNLYNSPPSEFKAETSIYDKGTMRDILARRYQSNSYIDSLCNPRALSSDYRTESSSLFFRFGRGLGPATLSNNNGDNYNIPTYVLFDDIADGQIRNILPSSDKSVWTEYNGSSSVWKINGTFARLTRVSRCHRGQPINGLIVLDRVVSAKRIGD